MRHITQTKFGSEEGNCFAACIACLFPVEIEDVPDFYQQAQSLWWDAFCLWMCEHFNVEPVITGHYESIPDPSTPYLIGGKAERGLMHSVIGRNGKVIWDPHPSRAGLIDQQDYTYFIENQCVDPSELTS